MSEIASSRQLRAALLRWLLVLVPGIVLLGFLSGKSGGSGADNPWFASLIKPATFPPPAAFGIVWGILYVMMAVALAIILTAKAAPGRWAAVGAFTVQLAINLAWSPVFFGAHQIMLGLAVIGVLDVALLVTVILFARVRPLAAALLVPYLAWALFATLLNYQFWQLNPQADGQQVSGAAVRVQI